MIYNIKRGLIMSREDILHNKFELVPYEKYIDLDHVNRYILRVSED